jgi:hypothetical protein
MIIRLRLQLCGSIILLFSASLIGFLFCRSLEGEMQNVVYPMFTNWVVVAAAAVELVVGLTCLLSRREAIARLSVLLFFVTVIWYRLSRVDSLFAAMAADAEEILPLSET